MVIEMKQLKSFFKYYSEQSPMLFYLILLLFIVSNMLLIINFVSPIDEYVKTARLVINSILLIACVMHLSFSLLLWRLNVYTFLASVGIITLIGFNWNLLGQTFEFFCTVVACFIALLAYGKNYRSILKIYFFCHILTVSIGIIGLLFGFTEPAYKVDSTDIGVSLGLIYPNHVGRMVFLILIIGWYLWGQRYRLILAIVSIVLAITMWSYIKCKTIALLMLAFPVCWWIISQNTSKSKQKSTDLNHKGIKYILIILMRLCLVVFPFICFALTYLLGLCRNFFMAHWHYGQGMYALWMRFISAGILFKAYGFPLLGRRLEERSIVLEVTNGQGYLAAIVDNAYIFYLIAIGGIALVSCMLWMAFGNYRILKNVDRALLLISIFMCGYGLIETVYFQFEHNFLFFYPLTATALAYIENTVSLVKELQPASDMIITDDNKSEALSK